MTNVNAPCRQCGKIFKAFHGVNSSDGYCSPEYSDRAITDFLWVCFFGGQKTWVSVLSLESQPIIVEFRVKVKLCSCCRLCIDMTGIYLCNVMLASNRIV